MPIFEFHCNSCDQDFEKLVFGADPEVECPHCGQTKGGKVDERLYRQGGGQADLYLQRRRQLLRRLLFRFLQHLWVMPFSCRGAPMCAPLRWADTQAPPIQCKVA